jgi:hypothetical protein
MAAKLQGEMLRAASYGRASLAPATNERLSAREDRKLLMFSPM